jgi:sirohydrochlorin ferrochelatase
MKRAVLLVDHGSRLPETQAALEQVAARVRHRLPDRIVRVAHLELARPNVAEGVDACVADGANEVVIQPYFLFPGAHATQDLPALARAAAGRHPGVSIRVAESLGVHEGLIDAILERIEAA